MSRIVKLDSEAEIIPLFKVSSGSIQIEKIAPDAEIQILANTVEENFQRPIFKLEDLFLAELSRINRPQTQNLSDKPRTDKSSKPKSEPSPQERPNLKEKREPKKPTPQPTPSLTPPSATNTPETKHTAKPPPNQAQIKPAPPPLQPSAPQEAPKPKHHLDSVISKLELLLNDAELHESLCEDPNVWKLYKRNTLKPLPSVIKEGLSLKKQETSLIESWVYHDVRPILDGLAQLFSYACKAEYRKTFSGEALKRDLQARLYGGIGFALAKLKLLNLQKLVPIQSDYNFFRPRQKIIQRVQVPEELVGKILGIERVGLYHPLDGHLLEEAEVIIGIEMEQPDQES